MWATRGSKASPARKKRPRGDSAAGHDKRWSGARPTSPLSPGWEEGTRGQGSSQRTYLTSPGGTKYGHSTGVRIMLRRTEQADPGNTAYHAERAVQQVDARYGPKPKSREHRGPLTGPNEHLPSAPTPGASAPMPAGAMIADSQSVDALVASR